MIHKISRGVRKLTQISTFIKKKTYKIDIKIKKQILAISFKY
jgi:hypothetical protein